jgi:hypothetical protein
VKIIFLDIDGVLNLRRRGRDKYGSLFHTPWVENLRKIVDATGAKIVISSTWRSAGVEEMQAMWKDRGLPGEVVGCTAMFGRLSRKELQYDLPRGCEIEHWLKFSSFQRINWCKIEQRKYLRKSKVKNYIILDDDSDMLFNQREHFLRCSRNHNHKNNIEGYGLTDEIARQAIKVLKTPITKLYYTDHEQI